MSDKEFLKYKSDSVEVAENGVIYIEETTYRVFTDGTKEVACSAKYPKPSVEPITPEPSQLDRIEATVNNIAENSTNYDEMAAAITEGVNDV